MPFVAVVTLLSGRLRRLRLQVLVEPVHISLQPIALVAWNRQAVELPGINHQLGIDAKALERLIHLLASRDRDVEVFLAAEKQASAS